MAKKEWFSTNGQILQAVTSVIALFFAGAKAWQDFRIDRMFTLGTTVFYLCCLTVICAIVLAIRSARRQPSPGPPAAAVAKLSSSEESLLDRARDNFRGLRFDQRVALRLVYNVPGQFAGDYIRQFEGLGFRDGEKIFRLLMGATILLETSPQMRVTHSAHRVVAELVEEEMAKPGWALI